ncbi:MAG: FAD-dependent oxidoreductase [Rhodoferax sp.]|uniref:NAD(P)/FAD-dependent oxidoreductase n=1 Tax=Rhodoferax sp. TaxID=50421 RepID=UPI0013FFC95F|nr:FAD-dependent oxidoreductase [Rhodoferax sp.]NDP37245.1 FAD-dependent oxidoreductase [Rhodoferax sp.]
MNQSRLPRKNIAIIGAGMAGVSCARTLVQAGHQVTLLEKSRDVGGRMATRDTPFGTFDSGTQYFTVRDPRFARALATVPSVCKAWSANTIRVLDEHGQIGTTSVPTAETHWVPTPGMNALVKRWAQPLLEHNSIELETRVTHLDRDAVHPKQWQLHTEGQDGSQHVFSGFDAVLLAIPAEQARLLLETSPQADALAQKIDRVDAAPCWTLMVAFPQAVQPGLTTLGPQWNAARSTHHRIAWLARESSKPGRGSVERWTVQASAAWSQEHLQDDVARVQAKLLKAFSEVTGIRAEPAHIDTQRWLYAQTTKPLGKSHLWDARAGLGVCGDWCLGHRVENAFVSGLELALAVV